MNFVESLKRMQGSQVDIRLRGLMLGLLLPVCKQGIGLVGTTSDFGVIDSDHRPGAHRLSGRLFQIMQHLFVSGLLLQAHPVYEPQINP